jgi:hypothetical protein
MKRPVLRVTKWLREIPVEATCTACAGVLFRAISSSHRPNRDEYANSLQAQFDEHLKITHSESGPEPL